jgi:hypothetical protein
MSKRDANSEKVIDLGIEVGGVRESSDEFVKGTDRQMPKPLGKIGHIFC